MTQPPPAGSAERGSPWRPLRARGFRLFVLGQAASQSGTWLQLVAMAWLTVQLTGSGTALGWITAATFGPLLLLGAWAGTLVDRCDTRRLLAVVQGAMAVQAASLAVLTLTGGLTAPVLFLLAIAYGLVYAVESPARQAFLAEVVDEPDLTAAVGLKSAVTACGRVLGPLAAGGLMITADLGWCFAVNAVSCLVALVALAAVRPADRLVPAPAPAGPGQVLAGLRYVWSVRELRAALTVTAVVATFGLNHHVVVPLLAQRTFGGGAGTYALLYAAMSAGAVCGALLVGRRTEIDGRFLGAAALGFGVATAGTALAPTLTLALLGSATAGATGMRLVAGSVALLQRRSDPMMRGRVMALSAMVVLGGLPVGAPVVGWVCEQFGPRWGLGLGAAAALVAGAVLLARTSDRSWRSSPAGALDSGTLSPAGAVDFRTPSPTGAVDSPTGLVDLRTPSPTVAPGTVLAAGRDATILAAAPGRVLRRLTDGGCMQREADVMAFVAARGFPVPTVHRVGPGELEMDHIPGPTMLADLLRHPWRLDRHARLLADLHHRLHAIRAPAALPSGPVSGDVVVHLDLHPGNIVLSPSGPVVIDWIHAARGHGASDVALTWTSLACFDHDARGLKAVLADRFRAVFLERFLNAAGRAEAATVLPAIVGYRLAHPRRGRNIRAGERAGMQRLAAAHNSEHYAAGVTA